jgi:predicted esterase
MITAQVARAAAAGLWLGAAGCGAADKTEAGDSGGADSGGADGGDNGPTLRPLAAPSGACPDMSATGGFTLTSGGVERAGTVVVPEAPAGPLKLMFFLHGLMDPGSTPDPTGEMVRGLGLQRVANENNALIVLPQSGIMELLGFRFFLWDLVVETDGDLVLFDDLRACAAEQHELDLPATSAFGFSGGALFTTVLIRERGDAFAAAVEASGGADISVPIWTTPGAAYGSPPAPLPTLLMSGGEADVWPDPSLTLVDFTAATDTLEAGLVTDGHTVVRCRHSSGHTIPQRGYQLALEWAFGHRFGEESPWAGGPGADDDWCAAGSATPAAPAR